MTRSFLVAALLLAPATVHAADVLVISNQYADFVATDFAVNTSHTLTSWDANMTPTLEDLQEHEVVLVFEDGQFANAPNIGDVVATYYEAGGRVVLASFYLQDRADAENGFSWGALEDYDPFTGEAGGCEYAPDDVDPASIVDHPITAGFGSLEVQAFRGGATAKADTTVLATWSGLNDLGLPDPVVGFRQDADNCIIAISTVPHGANFPDQVSGDYYTLFDNALTWAVACADQGPCHNGELDEGEECDDGNFQNGDACVGQCVLATCGDGWVQVGVEPCDDGDDQSTEDDCLPGCVAASCGDGYVQAGVEGCDDADDDNTDACIDTCQAASCGDGYVFEGFEECDDGNADANDGCTACMLDVEPTTSSTSDGGESSSSSDGGDGSESSSSSSAADDSTGTPGDGTSSGAPADTSGTADAGTAPGTDDGGADGSSSSSGGDAGADGEDSGCGCTSEPQSGAWWSVFGVLALRRRRRGASR